MARSIHTLAITSSTRNLERVRRFVVEHAEAANLPEDSVEQCKLAVDEACTNVIEHAYGGNDGHQVDIAIIIDQSRFVVRIRDRGHPFDLSKYREPDLVKYTKSRKAGGLGVRLMRSLMDHVEYRKRGTFNEIYLTKYLKAPTNNNP